MSFTRLSRPPESFRPDRTESICRVGERTPVELVMGVQMDCLVGPHNGARNLTTGLVNFAPGAHLPYHTHTVSESITLLVGSALAMVEGRIYHLNPLDNLVIPPGVAHSVRNGSSCAQARFHVAFPSVSPGREWITTRFEPQEVQEESTGARGMEHCTRFKTAPRSEAGPGTSFIDYFNRDLIPALEMSGGYGQFQPGGRLPAHFHDFDESICIIQGTATCMCEGRHHCLSDGATALQPRGRVHYFINNSEAPMAMLWVYAGPTPDRLLTQERCATEPGAAWPA